MHPSVYMGAVEMIKGDFYKLCFFIIQAEYPALQDSLFWLFEKMFDMKKYILVLTKFKKYGLIQT